MKILFMLLCIFCILYLTNALYAIYHSKIEQDYIRMRRDSRRQDSRELANDLRRVQLCDKVLKANTYFYVYHSEELHAESRQSRVKNLRQQSINRRNAQLRHYNSDSTLDAFKYQYSVKYVVIGTSVLTRIRMFLCSEDKKVESYVTFGFRDEHFFLLTKPKNADDFTLRIRAMLAPTPKLDTEISFVTTKDHYRVLDNYFWQFFRKGQSHHEVFNYHVLEFMQLCWLANDEYRHFDVCSAVANTLNKHTHYQNLHLNIARSNYVKKIPRSVGCTERLLLDNRTGDEVNVRVLPCMVNRNNWSYPQFYLLRDPNLSFQTSVFVLRPHHAEVRVLTLDAYVNGVSALMDFRNVSNSDENIMRNYIRSGTFVQSTLQN